MHRDMSIMIKHFLGGKYHGGNINMPKNLKAWALICDVKKTCSGVSWLHRANASAHNTTVS